MSDSRTFAAVEYVFARFGAPLAPGQAESRGFACGHNVETFVSHQSKSEMLKWIGWPDTLSWTHNKSASGSCDTYHALRTTMDPFKLGGAGADLSISLEPHDAARPMVSLMLGRASMYYNARDYCSHDGAWGMCFHPLRAVVVFQP